MRAYRHAFATGGNKKRLSQNGLLDLMGEVDREYADMDGHSTVARWESGATASYPEADRGIWPGPQPFTCGDRRSDFVGRP